MSETKRRGRPPKAKVESEETKPEVKVAVVDVAPPEPAPAVMPPVKPRNLTREYLASVVGEKRAAEMVKD